MTAFSPCCPCPEPAEALTVADVAADLAAEIAAACEPALATLADLPPCGGVTAATVADLRDALHRAIGLSQLLAALEPTA